MSQAIVGALSLWIALLLAGTSAAQEQRNANSAGAPAHAQSADVGTPSNGPSLPYRSPPFTGTLAPTVQESTQYLPAPVKPPPEAPNILLIMTDDVGFGASSTFGGPIPTPNFTRLAEQGLRYPQFNTTAVCSASRAALLTGRNHHHVGEGTTSEPTTPYPGYDGIIPNNADTIAEILRDNNYATAMFGKHHNALPSQIPNGPYNQWPVGMGFDYFYGFVGADSDQFHPALYENTAPVDGSHRPADYILDKDLADHAIEWLHKEKAATPDVPFFVYYAPGATHGPQQAPADWIAKFKGKFDQGWNKMREETLARQKAMGIVPPNTELSTWPSQVPSWDSLSPEEKTVYERYMEVYAAQLSYDDAQIGRVLDEVKRMGLSNDTIVVFIEGDNGGTGEGGPKGYIDELFNFNHVKGSNLDINHWLAQHLDIMGGPRAQDTYPAGWGLAMNSPYPWFKTIASHLGGVRNGLVISWPGHLTGVGGIRTQYGHIIDIMPTLLEVAHIKPPSTFNGIPQMPLDGVSLAYTFNDPNAASRHRIQYYEMMGNRGIYDDGWLANTTPRFMQWELGGLRPNSDVLSYPWELYDLRTDPGQAHNVAAKYPDRLKEMQALFDQEARKNNVYPIQDSGMGYRVRGLAHGLQNHYVFWGTGAKLNGMAVTPLFSAPFSIKADIDVPQRGASGVILAAGSWFGGWSFYLKNGTPTVSTAASNYPGQQARIAADKPLSAGKHGLEFDFTPGKNGNGTVTILDNGAEIGKGDIDPAPQIIAGVAESVDIGRDSGVPVTDDYSNEGVFTGTIQRVQFDSKFSSSAADSTGHQPSRLDPD